MTELLGFIFDGVTPFHGFALVLLSTQLRGIAKALGDLGQRVTRLELLPTARAELEVLARSQTVH